MRTVITALSALILMTGTAISAVSIVDWSAREASGEALEACGLPSIDAGHKANPRIPFADPSLSMNFRLIALHCDPNREIPQYVVEKAKSGGFDATNYSAIVEVFHACDIKEKPVSPTPGITVFDPVALVAANMLIKHCRTHHSE